jgi:K+-sensing histidine kinase KdpD
MPLPQDHASTAPLRSRQLDATILMTQLDLPAVFSLVAHELRSPASVIAGCARMLNEGRLNDEDRRRVYGQIGRAADRVTTIGQQSSDVARWLRDGTARIPTSPLSVRAVLQGAVAQSQAPARVEILEFADDALERLCLPVLDRPALICAVTAIVDLVCREVPEGTIAAAAYAGEPATSCDILIGPRDSLVSLSTADRSAILTSQPSLETGGMGLALVVCTAVVAAHDGHLLAFPDRRDVVGMRLPAQQEA